MANTSTFYDIRLAGMITARQNGDKLREIGKDYGLSENYAGRLLCQVGVYAYKRKNITPKIPVRVRRWIRLTENLVNAIKRFTS